MNSTLGKTAGIPKGLKAIAKKISKKEGLELNSKDMVRDHKLGGYMSNGSNPTEIKHYARNRVLAKKYNGTHIGKDRSSHAKDMLKNMQHESNKKNAPLTDPKNFDKYKINKKIAANEKLKKSGLKKTNTQW